MKALRVIFSPPYKIGKHMNPLTLRAVFMSKVDQLYDENHFCRHEGIWIPKDKAVISKTGRVQCPYCGYFLRTGESGNVITTRIRNRIVKQRMKDNEKRVKKSKEN